MKKIKDSTVHVQGLQPEMSFGDSIVTACFAYHGYDCIVTSINDGVHMASSKHYSGQAIDYRWWHVEPAHQKALYADLRDSLGSDFDVVLENEPVHLHVEWHQKTRVEVARHT